MKYGKQHVDKLLKGLLPLLAPATTPQLRTIKRSGSELLSEGITRTHKGDGIVRGKEYEINGTVDIPINHSNQIKKIIRAAKTDEQMTSLLGQYVARYGYQPEQKKSQNQTEK